MEHAAGYISRSELFMKEQLAAGMIKVRWCNCLTDLEGFAPNRHLTKEDGKSIVADETAKFMVIEFDRNEKRIVVSHTRIWEQGLVDEKEAAKKDAKVESDKTKKVVKNIQSKVEKATLGDLGVLADLKKKMEGGGEENAPAADEAKPE